MTQNKTTEEKIREILHGKKAVDPAHWHNNFEDIVVTQLLALILKESEEAVGEAIKKLKLKKLNLPKDKSLPLATREIEKHEFGYNQAVDELNTKLNQMKEKDETKEN